MMSQVGNMREGEKGIPDQEVAQARDWRNENEEWAGKELVPGACTHPYVL